MLFTGGINRLFIKGEAAQQPETFGNQKQGMVVFSQPIIDEEQYALIFPLQDMSAM